MTQKNFIYDLDNEKTEYVGVTVMQDNTSQCTGLVKMLLCSGLK